jgi:hypothetical protein
LRPEREATLGDALPRFAAADARPFQPETAKCCDGPTAAAFADFLYPPPPDAAARREASLAIARARAATVERWRNYARSRGHTAKVPSMESFALEEAQAGRYVGAMTLHHWERKHAQGGVEALVDPERRRR